MRKILSIFAAMLCAIAVSADPVVLPATLDVNNVGFRSDGMPDFVLEEGDYAGTYFDMGAHDSANDTLLYAEWDVTIEPIMYTVGVVVYNTNSWRVQLDLLNQADEVVKALRYKGSSGQCGQFAIGSLDLSDLEAGDYKVRARAATAWSAMKLKDVIFEADYQGVTVDLPGTLLPAYAELSANASVTDDAIAFKPSTANEEYATWNVSFAEAGTFNVTIDITASNCHDYSVALLSADGETEIAAIAESGCHEDTGVKELGAIAVPEAGNYVVKLTNATQWSNAVLSSIAFAVPAPAPEHTYTVAGDNVDLFGTAWTPANEDNDMVLQEDNTYKWEKTELALAAGSIQFKVCEDHAWTACWPTDNYVLNIAEAGIYTIAIYYNPNDNNYVGAQATKTGDAVVIPSVAMHGNFLGSWADTENFALAEGDATASLTLTLQAGDYEFGMRIGGAGNWTANGVAFSRDNASAEIVAGQGNLTLAADVAGDYVFTWTYESNTLAITFPEAAPQPVEDEFAEILFAAAMTAAEIAADAVFTVEDSEFSMQLTDPDDKIVIDENHCRFGVAEDYKMYDFRMKSGGKSTSSKNFITFNMPSAGVLRIAARTGSNSATDRNIVLVQGEDTVFNQIIQESMAVTVMEDETEVSVYPFVEIEVAAGAAVLSYPVGGMNFYSFAFKASGETPIVETAYYIVGSMNEWTPTADEAYKFVANPDNEGEYILHYTLAENDVFKVVEIASNSWYPAEGGEASNYVVDAAHAGEKEIFFRPDYQGGEGWHYGCIFIAATEIPTDAPAAAPAEPAYAGYQVKAVYSAKYNADCDFGEWGSATQYAQEAYGKKYVTGEMGYFGLAFESRHLDCSEMEALHLDVWTAEDIAFRVVPIHGGTEVGVTVNAQGMQWNVIDIALSEFEGVENWSDVYQIKIDNAANMTFWLNNVYFYTTQEKEVNLADGYYMIGSMNDWDIHNLAEEHMFAANPDNEGEFVLHYTLADGNEFKVVAVANNELGAWYPAEAGNYVVDYAHVGEKDILFRPAADGGDGWHAGCIFVEADPDASPWETWFAAGDTWNTETESYLEWDGVNHKAVIYINVDKYGQWRAQAKYHGPVAQAGKCYRIALKLKANNAISNVTIKYQDNDQNGAEMVYVQDAALEADTEFVFDQVAAGTDGGNGIMVLDFGFAHAGDIIEIYDVAIEEVECPHTYTVAGSSEVAFGTTWDPANAANDMVEQEDGSYKWEKEGLELAAGELKFKVCQDHAWTVAFPAQDYVVNIMESGIYTLTINFSNGEVSADAVKTGEAVVIPTVAMHGNFSGSWADSELFTIADDKATASLTLELVAGSYEFGMRIGGSGNWTANGAAFTRENNSAVVVAGQGNLTLAADIDGEYIFTWTYETNTLAITFPRGAGIDNTAVVDKVVKMIENGQLIIIKNGVRYNAQGMIVR